jgi:hypothetical protein
MYYNSELYNSGALAGTDETGSAAGGPVALNSYQNDPDIIVNYWTMDPYSSLITDPNFMWELETDLVDTFDSTDHNLYISHEQVFRVDVPFRSGDRATVTINDLVRQVSGDGVVNGVYYFISHNQTMANIASELITYHGTIISGYYLVDAVGALVTDLMLDTARGIVLEIINPANDFDVSNVGVVPASAYLGVGTPVFTWVRNTFVPGCVYRGMAIDAYPRLQAESLRMYWRVRGTYVGAATAWTSSFYDIPAAIDQSTRIASLALLPDPLYSKDAASNIYKIHDAFAKELDTYNREAQLVNNDIYVDTVRDSSIDDNFGVLTGIGRPSGMSRLDYREIVGAFMSAIRRAPTVSSVNEMVMAIYRTWPTYSNVRDMQEEYVVTNPDDTPWCILETDPTGAQALPFILDGQNISFGSIITIDNRLSAECKNIITTEFVASILGLMVPAHTPFYIR